VRHWVPPKREPAESGTADQAEPRKVLPFCLTGPPLGAIPVPDYDVRAKSDVLLVELGDGSW
jgi:hypothetical protein